MMQYGGTQTICPAGWNVPDNQDWLNLGNILGSEAGGQMKTTGTIEGGTGLWHAPNSFATNSSGFGALPGGWNDGAGNFTGMGYDAYFSNTRTWYYDWFKYYLRLNYNDGNMWFDGFQYTSYSMSVRCFKYVTPAVVPTVSTSSVTEITTTTAVGGGYVTDEGDADVTARGVVWSTTQNPTVAVNEGITTFTSNLTSLTPGTTYFVKAYATNSEGTAYGLEVEFMTSIPSILTVSDLIINAGTIACYNASQTITVSNCTVKPTGSVNFISGGNIRLLTATKVENGGNLHAYITTNQTYCTQNKSMVTLPDDELPKGGITMELDEAASLFTLFPNPTTSAFTLQMIKFESTQSIQLAIFGMRGEKIMQTELSGQRQYEIDLTGMQKGVYFIRVITGNGMGVEKLIKQ